MLSVNPQEKQITVNERYRNVVITNNETGEAITVNQPVTDIITVMHPGPQGQAGTSGLAVSSSYSLTSSFAQSGRGTFSGSFSGSFQGDGGSLTGIVSSKWTGSATISRLGNVQVTGSLIVTTGVTGSLFGTSSHALTASYVNINNVSNSFWAVGGNNFADITTQSLGINSTQSLNITTNSSSRIFISSSGEIGIRTTIPSASFHIKSKGASSATNGFMFSDSSQQIKLFIRDDGFTSFTPASFGTGINVGTLAGFGAVGLSVSSSGIGVVTFLQAGQINFGQTTAVSPNGSIRIGNNAVFATTSNNAVDVGIGSTFGPSSGIAAYKNILINPVISQSQSTGDIIGIDYAPTLTILSGSHYAAWFRSGVVSGTEFRGVSFTGSLQGTGSWAISASHVLTASSVEILRQAVTITGSFAVSGGASFNSGTASFWNINVSPGMLRPNTDGQSVQIYSVDDFNTSLSGSSGRSLAIIGNRTVGSSGGMLQISSRTLDLSASSYVTVRIFNNVYSIAEGWPYTALAISPNISQSNSSGSIIGIDYSPTLTSISGSHIAAIFRSGTVSGSNFKGGNFSGSFSGSFQGDGSGLTGVGGGSSKWTGSSAINRLGDVQVTGSFSNVISGSQDFTITASGVPPIFFVSASGKIGIGTNTPTASLEILSEAYTPGGHGSIYLKHSSSVAAKGTLGPGIIFGASSPNIVSTIDGAGISSIQGSDDPDNTGIAIHLRNDTNTANRLLNILLVNTASEGRVGINLTSGSYPDYNLEVEGDAKFTSNITTEGIVLSEDGIRNDTFLWYAAATAGHTAVQDVLVLMCATSASDSGSGNNTNFINGSYYARRSTTGTKETAVVNINFNTSTNGAHSGGITSYDVSEDNPKVSLVKCSYSGSDHIALRFSGSATLSGTSYFQGFINSTSASVAIFTVIPYVSASNVEEVSDFETGSASHFSYNFNARNIYKKVSVGKTGSVASNVVLDISGSTLITGSLNVVDSISTFNTSSTHNIVGNSLFGIGNSDGNFHISAATSSTSPRLFVKIGDPYTINVRLGLQRFNGGVTASAGYAISETNNPVQTWFEGAYTHNATAYNGRADTSYPYYETYLPALKTKEFGFVSASVNATFSGSNYFTASIILIGDTSIKQNIYGTFPTFIHRFTGSVNLANGITGSLLGTGSWAISASHALTASSVGILRQELIISGSATGSYLIMGNTSRPNIWPVGINTVIQGPGGESNILLRGSTNKGVSLYDNLYVNSGSVTQYASTGTGSLLALGNGSLTFITKPGTGSTNLNYSNFLTPFSISSFGTSSFSGSVEITSRLFVSGAAIITGSTSLRGVVSVTGSMVVSGSTSSSLAVYGSGSTVFSVHGSAGILLAINDGLSGSLYSVNNISGLPIMEVLSDDTILTGNYLARSLHTTKRTTANSGSTVIFTIPTSSYTSMFYEYTIQSGSNTRAGNIVATWNTASLVFSETSTADIGNTSNFTCSVLLSGSSVNLTGSVNTNGWTIKTIVRAI